MVSGCLPDKRKVRRAIERPGLVASEIIGQVGQSQNPVAFTIKQDHRRISGSLALPLADGRSGQFRNAVLLW